MTNDCELPLSDLKSMEMGVNWTGVNKEAWQSRRDTWCLECDSAESFQQAKGLLRDFEQVLKPDALDPSYLANRQNWNTSLQAATYLQ